MSEWETIGEIGVDAGLCWLGDPCYILHKKNPPKSIGKSWSGCSNEITEKDHHQFNYDLGHAGLGVVVSTGYGDGTYPVQIRKKEGRIAEVRVKFID